MYYDMYIKTTITLPEHLIGMLNMSIEKGKKSNFIAKAIEEKLFRMKIENVRRSKENPIDELIEFTKDLPKSNHEEIMKSIKKGRI